MLAQPCYIQLGNAIGFIWHCVHKQKRRQIGLSVKLTQTTADKLSSGKTVKPLPAHSL